MTNEEAKLTVTIETKTSRRTLVYPRVFDLQFRESFPDPRLGGYRDGGLMRPPEQTHMNAEITMIAAKGADGYFRTAEVEKLDPIPSEIAKLVDEFTGNNVNAQQRAKLKRQLIQLVENDRKENNK